MYNFQIDDVVIFFNSSIFDLSASGLNFTKILHIIIHFLLGTLNNENYIASTNIFKMMLFMQLSSNYFELHCYVSNFIYNNQACIYFYGIKNRL